MKRRVIGVVVLIALATATASVTSAIVGRRDQRRASHPNRASTQLPNSTTVLGSLGDYTPERLRAIYQEHINRERGTIVGFDPEEGSSLAADEDHQDAHLEAARNDFAAIFPVSDPQPVERVEHFRWLDQPGIKRLGWYATVRDIRIGAGGYFVKVRLRPYLVSDAAAVTMTSDYFNESYFVDDTGVGYLGGTGAPPDSPKMLFGD